MTEAVEKRIADLKRKLKARTGDRYAANRLAIQKEIDRLEDVLKKAQARD